MGCCGSSYEKIDEVDREAQRLLKKAPNESSFQTLMFIIQQRQGESWAAPLQQWHQVDGWHVIDCVLFVLKSNGDTVHRSLRTMLLEFLYELLAAKPARLYFDMIEQKGPLMMTRLDRLKTLLREDNEETEVGRRLLKRLNYLSVLFEKVAARWTIKYTMIVDKSGSMQQKEHGHTRWHDAKRAAEHMATRLEPLTAGGLALWLFSTPSRHPRFDGLRSADQVHSVFHHQRPEGSTDLAGVLQQAFEEHFRHRQPEHILVVTDGQPDNKALVVHVLVQNINLLHDENELGLTFMQVGDDHDAAEFLHELQDCITEKGARYNVVDCITHHQYCGKSLSAVIDQYLPTG
eukprot:TRINITY_DN5072_c0_g1_i1.p1 TRINITY_DN5072_c0_g1~~TRINITY_DN5072_c0_g1_i1.p1  ORF type:complete len:347 (+),score=130.88 TRINITY_DN5072_c0_g1_i1:158-1198(+)